MAKARHFRIDLMIQEDKKKKLKRACAGIAAVGVILGNMAPVALAKSYVDEDADTIYEQLQDAVNEAASRYDEDSEIHTVTMTEDETGHITIDTSMNLDMNGCTLDGEQEQGSVITVVNNEDSENETVVVISNGTITGGNAKTSNDGVGGGVHVNGSTVTLEEMTITENNAQTGGGVGVENGGDLTIVDSEISNNTATKSGGGVSASSGASLDISGSEILDNSATQTGGGVYIYAGKATDVEAQISDTTISENSATNAGGGIYIGHANNNSSVEVKIAESEISDNTAESTGGGIYSYGDTRIENSEIIGNAANSSYVSTAGGGIVVMGGITNIVDTIITENYAATGGGGVGAYNVGEVEISGGSLYGNNAEKVGNDISVSQNASVTVSDVKGIDTPSEDYHYQSGYVDGGFESYFNSLNDTKRFGENGEITEKIEETVLTGNIAVTSGAVYNVTYLDGNGNKYDGGQYIADDSHTVLDNDVIGFENEGYTFNGWVDAQGNPVNAEELIAVKENITIFAQWLAPEPVTDPDDPETPAVNDEEDPVLPIVTPAAPIELEEEIPVEEIPIEEIPVEEVVPVEETPQETLPQTGQNWALSGLLGAMGALLASAGILTQKKRRENEDEA